MSIFNTDFNMPGFVINSNTNPIKQLAVILCIFVLCIECGKEKIRYTSERECDRFSLDAVYHEKFKLVTTNIFADCTEFVSRVSELVAKDLIDIMAELTGKDVSDNEERKIHHQFGGPKNIFLNKVKKIEGNITSHWERLMSTNFDLLYDNGKTSLNEYKLKMQLLADVYKFSRISLDGNLSGFVRVIKRTIRDGLQGISQSASNSLKMEEEKKKMNTTAKMDDNEIEETDEIVAEAPEETEDILNESAAEIPVEKVQTSNSPQHETTTDKNEANIGAKNTNTDEEKEESNKEKGETGDDKTEETPEEKLKKKKLEIAELILQGFVKTVTVEAIKRDTDLFKESNLKADDRDSVLDDIIFDVLMMKSRISAIIQPDLSNDKGVVDTARRSIFAYWVDLAEGMYKEKKRAKKSGTSKPELYYEKLWSDESKLAETMLDLMEVY